MDGENRGFTGIWIPAHILLDDSITIAEKAIYGYVASFRKACLQNNETIANRLNCSEKTITRSLKTLAEKNYIFVESVNGSNNNRRIYAIFDNPKKLFYLAKKGAFVPSGQNVQTSKSLGQNVQSLGQIVHTANRGTLGQNVHHRIKDKSRITTDSLAKTPESVDSVKNSEGYKQFVELGKKLKFKKAELEGVTT